MSPIQQFILNIKTNHLTKSLNIASTSLSKWFIILWTLLYHFLTATECDLITAGQKAWKYPITRIKSRTC